MYKTYCRKLSLTVDYEIFGNGTGDVRKHVTEPTERMCRIAEKFGMPVTVFFELEEYLQFVRHRDELKRTLGYDPAEEMERQAVDLVSRGHDIQLHLHPQWYGAGYAGGEWQLHHDRLTVDALFDSQSETTEYIKSRKESLEAVSGRPVTCYRAGGFAAQPGTRLLRALADTGFILESSVVKGLHRQRPHPLDYRAAPKDRRAWRISTDVAAEDTGGPLWEVPVHSVMGRRYHQLTFNRLKAKFSRHVPRARQHEMMDQLGIRKSVGGIASFLFQPVPIKLDFHNLTPRGLMRMIRRAPAAPASDPDVLVLIGHTKEHSDDVAFEEFLRRISLDRRLEVVSMGAIASGREFAGIARPVHTRTAPVPALESAHV
jgi:peptidoglycan/xylan/chitin deacetylase (PgdA/CDA1 family)